MGPLVASWPSLPACRALGCWCRLPGWTGGSPRADMTIPFPLHPQCPAQCLAADEWSLGGGFWALAVLGRAFHGIFHLASPLPLSCF